MARLLGRRALQAVLPLPVRRGCRLPVQSRERRRLLAAMTPTPNGSPCRGLRVLFWVPGGMPALLSIEGTIATALRLRGADVMMVTCDGSIRACVQRSVLDAAKPSEWSATCPSCSKGCGTVASSFALTHRTFGDFLPPGRTAELRQRVAEISDHDLASFRHLDVEVGRYALSATVRYLQGLPHEGRTDLLREHLVSAMIVTESAHSALEEWEPDRLFMSHGLYTDWGPALSLAVSRSIPVTAYMMGYDYNRQFFRTVRGTRHLDFHALSPEGWVRRKAQPLTTAEEAELQNYLWSRYHTRRAFDIRPAPPQESPDEVRQALQIPRGRPVWCVFAHLSWDAVFDYSPMAFETFDAWLDATLRTACETRDVTWLIKVHPSECRLPPACGVGQRIHDRFPNLPDHVRLVPPDAPVNNDALYPLLDGAATVYGTAGLELAVRGRPVILAGQAHYSGKGFTHDAASPVEYVELLRRAARLGRLTDEQQRLAHLYAFNYFLERQIPLRMIERGYSGWGPLDLNRLHLLRPGRDAALDMICDRIARGGDFMLPRDVQRTYET